MQSRHEVLLLAPSLLGPVPSTLADAVADLPSCRQLERFLSRCRYKPRDKALDGEAALCEGLQQFIPDGDQTWPSSGAIAASALGLADGRRHYRAAPVHLRADRDRVLLFAGNDLRLSAEDANSLTRDFNQLYNDIQISLSFAQDHWVLSVEEAPGPDLPALASVAGRYLDAVMPTDAASQKWRQLLNEIQMFLYDHPVNQKRAAAGELSVNGFWFWGGGMQQPLALAAGGRLIGNDPIARGIAELAKLPIESLDQLERTQSYDYSVVVWDIAEQALLGGDASAWLQALAQFNERFGPLVERALADRSLAMTLDTGACRYTPDRRWFHRLLSRDKALVDWIERA